MLLQLHLLPCQILIRAQNPCRLFYRLLRCYVLGLQLFLHVFQLVLEHGVFFLECSDFGYRILICLLHCYSVRAKLRYFVLLVGELIRQLLVYRLQLGYRIQAFVHLASKVFFVICLLVALGLGRKRLLFPTELA